MFGEFGMVPGAARMQSIVIGSTASECPCLGYFRKLVGWLQLHSQYQFYNEK
jgi:hypothetical protein